MTPKFGLRAFALAAGLVVLLGGVSTADARGISSHSYSTSHVTAPKTTTSKSLATREQIPSYIARDSRGRIKRSAEARNEFKREHPCPSTGRSTGACPGYVIDHVTALKRGGADAPSNMQWQTIQAAKAKDKVE